MKCFVRFFLLIAAVGALTAVASADPIILNSNSGTVTYLGSGPSNANSNPAADYSTLILAESSTGFVAAAGPTVNIGTGGNVWSGPITGTSWVSFEDSEPGKLVPASGTYFFQASLGSGVTDATITLLADDTVAVYLNGILIPGTPAGTATAGKCTAAEPNCSISSVYDLPMSDFSTGSNTLTFGVEQLYGSAMGLDFQVNAAPEPSSLLLLGTGLLGAAEAFRRRIRK